MGQLASWILVCAVAGAGSVAHAQSQTGTAENAVAGELAIAAQPLESALKAVGQRLRLQIVYVTEVVEGKRSPGAPGGLAATETLEKVLEGTGLTYKFLTDHTVSIQPKAQESARVEGAGLRLAQADSPQAAAPAASAQGEGEAGGLDEVVVRGVRFHGDEASTALKVPLSIKDTPQTVMAITRDMMDFAAIKTFQDVYKVDATGGTTHRLDNFTVNYYRGFRQQSNNAIKIDGFRLLVDTNLDFAPFERLEVVKGATSTMYGQNSIAGTLNIISKMPKSHFGGEVKAEAGSFDHYRAEADFYGPITADGALTYRMVAARLDEGSYLDYAGRTATVFAPTLRYEFNDRTSLFARVNYQKFEIAAAPAAGMQYLGDPIEAFSTGYDPALLQIPNLPRSFFSGQDWGKNQEREVILVHAGLEHRFANDWTLRVNAQHNRQNLDRYNWLQHVGVIQDDGVPLASIIVLFKDVDWMLKAGEVNLYGDIEAFGRKHTLFIGADYTESGDAHGDPRLLAVALPASVPSLFSPGYNQAVPQPQSLADYLTYNFAGSKAENSGITAQALLRPLDRLTVLVAGRYSRAKSSSSFQVTTGPVSYDSESSSKVTSQAGLTYALTPDLNLYASYGETFEPQGGLIAPGQPIDPQEGTLKEVGFKGDLAKRFAYSLALFDMKRSNISQSNPANPGFVVPLGTQRSRGVEAAVQGTVLPGWEVYGSLGVMDAEYIRGNFTGYQPENAPKFGLSVFTSYEMQQGMLRGLGFGAGVVHKKGRETFFTQRATSGERLQFDFGDYTEVDVRLFRNFDRWRVQLSATNLFNEKYYTPIENDITVGMYVNPGRSIIGQAAYRF